MVCFRPGQPSAEWNCFLSAPWSSPMGMKCHEVCPHRLQISPFMDILPGAVSANQQRS